MLALEYMKTLKCLELLQFLHWKKHIYIIEVMKQTRSEEILSLSSRFPTFSEAETLECEALSSISQMSSLSSSTNPP